MSLKYVQSNTLYQAGSGVIIGATSIVLTTLTDIYGNVLTMTSFGAKGYGTCEPDTTNEESFTFTGITANVNGTYTLTGVSTALAQSPYTETSGLVRGHIGGSKVVISDTTAFWNTFANVNNLNTFIILPQSSVTPVNSSDFATKAYVDATAVAGAPNASTTVKGVVQEATQAQVLSKTQVGSTGADLYVTPSTLASTLLSDYKADTGAADAAVITLVPAITAYTAGQCFSVKMIATNLTTTPTLNVSALGAKTIVKLGGAAMSASDLLIGGIYDFEYDGTNMQLKTPASTAIAKGLKSATTIVDVSAATAPSNTQVLTATSATTATWQTPATSFFGVSGKGTASKNMSDASTTQTIAHGLGHIPALFRLVGVAPSGGGTSALSIAISSSGNSLTYTAQTINSITTFSLAGGSSTYQEGIVTADATNINIVWTRGGSPTGTATIDWEAFA